MSHKPKARMSAQELFDEAIATQQKGNVTTSDLRLLASGFVALRRAENAKINELELKVVRSIIAYTAETQKANEETIAAILSAAFGVKDIPSLPSHRYNEIVEYLVDLQFEKHIN